MPAVTEALPWQGPAATDMRHIISILLENHAGALARVANLFSSRGFNIESLNVAPTNDETVSRLTLVTIGSDDVIDQISNQLGKLVDIVTILDMTGADHIERELALLKVQAPDELRAKLTSRVQELGGRILDDSEGRLTVELIGDGPEIDRIIAEVAGLTKVETVVRSGAMGVARGAPIMTSRTSAP